MNKESLWQKNFQLNRRTPKDYVGAVIDTAQQMPWCAEMVQIELNTPVNSQVTTGLLSGGLFVKPKNQSQALKWKIAPPSLNNAGLTDKFKQSRIVTRINLRPTRLAHTLVKFGQYFVNWTQTSRAKMGVCSFWSA